MQDQNQPHLNQPQQSQQQRRPQQQDQGSQGDSPFGAEDREKRLFKISPLKPNSSNVSYEVRLKETEEGNVETQHINRKYISGGVEITPTTVCGQCEKCKEINLNSIFIYCGLCGKRLCSKCRRYFLRKGYCKWTCIFIELFFWPIKLLFRIITQAILIIIKDILRG